MTFYKRNGILYVRINGKRVSTKLKDTPSNRKLVLSYHKNDEFFKKFDVKNKVSNVLDLCEEVLREKESTLKSTSYMVYTSVFKSSIIPHFDKFVNQVEPLDIDIWYKTFRSKSAIITAEAILKPAFEKAILKKEITSSPFIVSKPKIKSNYEIKPFTLEEIEMLLNGCNDWFKNFLGLAFYTGMRIGEIIALKWEDIDFIDFTIDINKTQTNGFLQTPKTKSSIRIIDMLPQAEMYLKMQRKETGLCEHVFYPNGATIKSSSSLNFKWTKLLKKVNITYRNPYQTRHSFASNMLSNREELNWVSQMLGHKNPAITQQHYFKYIPKRVSGRRTTFLDSNDTKSTQYS